MISDARSSEGRFGLRAVLPAATLVLLTFGLALFATYWAAHLSDSLAMKRQMLVVANAVQVERAEVVKEQSTVAVWDEAALRLAIPDATSLAWAHDNIGAWLFDTFGHDEVYIVSSEGRALYAMRGGRRVSPLAYERSGPDLEGFVESLRKSGRGSASDLMHVGGQPAFVSVSKVRAQTAPVRAKTPSRQILVSVVRLQGGFMGKLARRNLLPEARFTTEARFGPQEQRLALADIHGRSMGWVVWTPTLPGLSVLRAVMPITAAALALILLVMAGFLRHLYRVTRQLHASKAHATRLALHDVLTGLPNRALFGDRLDQALARVRRGDDQIALIYLDLDRFKAVNDRLGHAAGDALIRAFADRAAGVLRSSDTLARFGGDEFAVIQTGVSCAADVERLCERLLACVTDPFAVGGGQASVGVSIGYALAPVDGVDRVDLSRKADIALYASKEAGRGRASPFRLAMDESVAHRGQIEADLRLALAAGDQLEVHYQPQYAVAGQRLVGLEALVRWRHPLGGMMSPDQFVPVAEESGLIVVLGEWVLAQACAVASSRPDLVISVNVSPIQLTAWDAADRILAIVRQAGADPRMLELEVNETAFLDDMEAIAGAVAHLRAAGMRLALDDFGTGYASLVRLKAVAVDRIKIDRTLVGDLESSSDAHAVVEALIHLAKALKIRLTAEGVETLAQMRRLKMLGCEEMQGYFFARPARMEDLDLSTSPSGVGAAVKAS